MSRVNSTARLASPVPSNQEHGTTTIRQIPTPSQQNTGSQTPLAGAGDSIIGPGRSALAAAFGGASPPRFGTPPVRSLSPAATSEVTSREPGIYGSFDARSGNVPDSTANDSFAQQAEVVSRHLVRPSNEDLSRPGRPSLSNRGSNSRIRAREGNAVEGPDLDEFSSLQLQGGDTTREIYRWTEEARAQSQNAGRPTRSKSFNAPRPPAEDEVLDIQSIKVPGGLRRDYLRRAAASPSPAPRHRYAGGPDVEQAASKNPPKLLTNNFIEFLTLYGHFAGEDLQGDDEDEYYPEDYFSAGIYDEDQEGQEPGEGSALLTPRTPGGRKRPKPQGRGTVTDAMLLLLKSFVGTGVLFLPRAFLNGGILFSSFVLLGVASLTYYCFILLVTTRLKVEGSFGDIGGILYGKWMRGFILGALVLSQVGFVAAYIVFTSENLQAFVVAVSNCRTWIDIKLMVLMQLVIFLPLSLIRDISKLSATALVADLFIMMGLVYLYYFDITAIIANGGVSDVVSFNARSWTLFVGTAVFTFEGVGLIIPIQESMRNPSQFPPVLATVMVIITVIYISMGTLSYAAFGSATKTVILLNLPQDDRFVNAVQALYSLAILLSTPLQLFPAIRILETEFFTRSGKFNPYIKWKKNCFRFIFVVLCALIAWGGAGDLDKFVSLVGSFACVPLVYIFPVSTL